MRALVIWGALTVITLTPIVLAANSPFLEARNLAYVIGGFAGITALSVLLVQPLLAADLLGLSPRTSRKAHRILGSTLGLLTVTHIVGLYITSPPDTLDALLLRSPTPFSVYGVLAMIAVFATALVALLRKRIRASRWAIVHNVLAVVIVLSTCIHALQIQGTMEPLSKTLICVAAGLTLIGAILRIRILKPLAKRP